MSMMLMIHPDRCTGCRSCELACSLHHESTFRPKSSRIHVYSWQAESFSVPMMCQQCNDAACVNVCMPKALTRNVVTGQVDLDDDKCIGCKMCVQACPFGAAQWDFGDTKILRCDTCDSDPQCARICPTAALEWLEDSVTIQSRKKAYAAKLKDAFAEA